MARIRKKSIRKKTKKRGRRKEGISPVTPNRLLKAIDGSGGTVSNIARRLGVTYSRVHFILKKDNRPKWDVCKDALVHEREKITDLAENTLREMLAQRIDLNEAARSARWVLERLGKGRGYRKSDELTLQGGKRPIHVKQERILPIESLDLPLEVRKQILAAMKKRDEDAEEE